MPRARLPYVDEETEKRRARMRRQNAQQRERKQPTMRAIIDEFLAQPCVDCGQTFPLPAMHPDHIQPKKYKIAWFRGGNGTVDQLRAELAKCEPRCANCHCIRHAG